MGGNKIIIRMTKEEAKDFSAKKLGVKYIEERESEENKYIKVEHPRFEVVEEAALIPTYMLEDAKKYIKRITKK